MLRLALACLLLFLVQLSLESNPLPNEDWDSGQVDLGNDGDRLFYLLVKCRTCLAPAPLVMWLAGGPGSPSVPAQYLENGPCLFNASFQLESSPLAWTHYVDVIYVDNPVGVSFSVAKSKATLCRNETCVAKNLYYFLLKFFDLHPEYRHRPFYLSGESYAGHYVPAFGALLTRTQHPDIAFVGVAIGNGLMNYYQQLPYSSEYLRMNGNITGLFSLFMRIGEWLCEAAQLVSDDFVGTGCTDAMFTFAQLAGIFDVSDITNKKPPDPEFYARFVKFLNSSEVRQAFGVPDRYFDVGSSEVYAAMRGDVSLSLSADLAYLLDNGKKVLLWHGDKDYICNWPGGLRVAEDIPWIGNQEFRLIPFGDWRNDHGDLLGLIKQHKGLIYLRVYNGGHSIFIRQKTAGLAALLQLLKPHYILFSIVVGWCLYPAVL